MTDDRPCQDEPGREAGKLSRWFASRLNARQVVREATAKCHWDNCPLGADCVHAKIPSEQGKTNG